MTSSKLQPYLLKQPLKTQKKLNELVIAYQNVQSIFLFLDITKVADFWWKNADISRSQGVCHMIYIFFGTFLGKV